MREQKPEPLIRNGPKKGARSKPPLIIRQLVRIPYKFVPREDVRFTVGLSFLVLVGY